MNILDRYIGITVALSVLLVLSVLIALDSFFGFLAELDDLGKGRYGLLEAMVYMVLTLPGRIYEFFPMAGLLGALLGLGMLATNSELIVVRGAGVSLNRVVLSVMKTGALLVVIVVIIGEVIAPFTQQYARSRRSVAMSDQITMETKYGFWARDKSSYINIRSIKTGGIIGDIYIYEFDDNHELRTSTYARQAFYVDGTWLLQDIVQSQISQDEIVSQKIARAEWTSLLSPGLLSAVVVNPEDLSAWNLNSYVNFLEENGQSAERYQLAFWIKVISPIATGVMIFLAVPFVFGPLAQVGLGQRILIGTLVGVSFYVVNQAFNHLGLAYHFSPFLSAVLPSVLFFGLALAMMRRVH